MGGFLDKPKTEIHNEEGKANDLSFAVGSMQGWRCEMEDAYCALTEMNKELKGWSFFAVFDGHAGRNVSSYCSDNLVHVITFTQDFMNGDYAKGIRTGFLRVDRDMRHYLRNKCGGTTVVCAFVSPTQIFIAHCGDSRAVLCRQGTPVFATQDHKPDLPVEKERICKAGGSVMIKRVNGTLAVSRALGDFDFKHVQGKGEWEQLVSPEPDIYCHSRLETDEFLVLACDGIWDVMSNEDVCSFIYSRLKITNDLVCIANSIIDICLNKGSRDNMSIIIITFPGAPKISEEALAAEVRLEEEIEKIIREEIERSESKDYSELLASLKDRNIEGLPPGGGIHSQYNLIRRIFKEYLPDKEIETTSQ